MIQAQVAAARADQLEQHREHLKAQLADAEIRLIEMGSLQAIREDLKTQSAAINELARVSGRRKMIAEREKAGSREDTK